MNEEQKSIAFNDLFYLVQQLFAYYSWTTKISPCVEKSEMNMLHLGLVKNAVVEAQIMYYRKLNETFLPKDPRYKDDLKVELFGYEPNEGFIKKEELKELHKRVAHPTTRNAIHGKVSFEIYDTSHSALKHSLPFLEHAAMNYYRKGSKESKDLLGSVDVLKTIWETWSLQVEPTRRRKL
tara:strand:+ start:51 stop:590 length:540 start_codon:yes stop_codon:yes gene_type:complete